jgi:copper chaperone
VEEIMGELPAIREFRVEGMTCGHCERAVIGALESVFGTGKAKVSLPEGKAWVEGSADPRALIAAVAEEGYLATLVVPASGVGP